MADVPAPHLDDRKSDTLRAVFVLFGRGLVYAVAFWLVYAIFFRAPWWAGSKSTDDDDSRRQAQAWKSFDTQQARTLSAMDESEGQQKRMAVILTKQEELLQRFERVIAGWEKSSPSKR